MDSLPVNTMDISQWVGNVTNFSATGVLAWVVYYMLSKAVPDIIAKFTADNATARTAFLAEITDSRKTFREEIAAERQHCLEELAKSDQRSRDVFDALTRESSPPKPCENPK